MKIKTRRLNPNLPARPEHVIGFKTEFGKAFDEMMANGRPTTNEGWKEVNDKLDTVEAELRAKYPTEIELSLTYIKELEGVVDEFGAFSVYKDDEGVLRFSIINEQ